MTDTTTAAVAAPVAPVAPVVAPAAVAAPVAPVAAPAAPDPVAGPPAGESILDTAPAAPAAPVPPIVSLEDAQKIVDAARLAAQPNSGLAWNLDDKTPGVGVKPDWLKTDKYKSVADQAKAYPELEKRFGAFTGAPKDDKGQIVYKPTLPEGVTIDTNHPVIQEFNKLAGDMQLNQQGYDKLMGLLAQYEASQAPNPMAEKAKLGDNADARISAVTSWAKNNLDANGLQLMRAVTAGHEMVPAFALLEQVIAKTGQVRMPKPGEDVASPNAGGIASIVELQGKRNAKNERLYEVDPAHRKIVDEAWKAHYQANPVQRDRHGHIRG